MSRVDGRRSTWLVRLPLLEIRKLVTTSATRALLLVMIGLGGALSVGVQLVAVLAGGATETSYAAGLLVLTAPVAIGIPIIGVLVFTSDWQQRDMLTMLLLEPRRHRIFWAKVIATTSAGVAVVVSAVALSLVLTFAASVGTSTRFAWGDDLSAPIASVLAYAFVGTLFGAAIGAFTLNSPLGVVLVILQTLVVDIAIGLIPGGVGAWLQSSALPDFLSGAGEAEHAATSFAIWLVIPFVGGYLRNERREAR